MENPDNATCKDCDAEIWAFMLHDDIWKQAGLPPKGYGCEACVAKRLGRTLELSDYVDVPINWNNVEGFFEYRQAHPEIHHPDFTEGGLYGQPRFRRQS